MWKTIVPIIFIFYFFALLQNSFFVHFNLMGASPNLVFILFFLLAFFSAKSSAILNWEIVLLAIIAGFFIDIFSFSYLGPSIILFILLGALLKKILSSLQYKEEPRPFSYFLPLFIICFIAYNILIDLYLYFLDPSKITILLSFNVIYALIYSLIFAIVFFFIYKKWLKRL